MKRAEDIIDLLFALYRDRDKGLVGAVMEALFDETEQNVIVGTGFCELCESYEARRGLFENDLKYWYDLHIKPETAKVERFGCCEVISVKAYSMITVGNGALDAKDCAEYLQEVLKTEQTPLQKASEIEWLLSHLLTPAGLEAYTRPQALDINLMREEGRTRLLCFNPIKEEGERDCLLNWDSMRQRYVAFTQKEGDNADGALVAKLTARGFRDVHARRVGPFFYGLAIDERGADPLEGLEERVEAATDAPSVRSLYEMQRDLSFRLMKKASPSPLRYVTRFHGLAEGGEIRWIKTYYPNY